jgi:hypothetical protein
MIVGGTHHQAHAWSYKTRVIYSATLFVTPSRQHQENKWMKWMLAFCCKSINFANEKEIKLYWQNKL